MKKIFLGLSLVCLLLGKAQSLAAELPKIGYGASNAVLSAKNQELFFMGFELGLETSLKGRYSVSDILEVEKIYDGSPDGALIAAKRLLERGVVGLFGFPTSHEALLASLVGSETETLSFFSGAGHSDLGKRGPSVFSTGETMEYSSQQMILFLQAHFKNKRGLLIENPLAVFSKNNADTIEKLNQNLQLERAQLDSQLRLRSEDLKKLLTNKIDYLVVTTYPDESVSLLEQLSTQGVELPILTNSSWMTGDIEFLRKYLVQWSSPIYSATFWIRGSDPSKAFEKRLRERFGRDASAEISYGYDLGRIAGEIYLRAKRPVTRRSLLEALSSQPCFQNLSTGTICFPSSGGFSGRQLKFVRFNRLGLGEVFWVSGE